MLNRLFYRGSSSAHLAKDSSWTELSNGNGSAPPSPTSTSSRRSQLLDLARSDSDVLESEPGSVNEPDNKESGGGLENGGNAFAYLSLRWRPSLLVHVAACVAILTSALLGVMTTKTITSAPAPPAPLTFSRPSFRSGRPSAHSHSLQSWKAKSTEQTVASITTVEGVLLPGEVLAGASFFLSWADRQRLAATQKIETLLANPSESRDAILRKVESAATVASSAAGAAAAALRKGCRWLEEVLEEGRQFYEKRQ